MKKLKRIFCFLLALILVLGEPDIAEAFSIGNGGNSGTSTGGGYLYGSRDSWGYRLGIAETKAGVDLTDKCIYHFGVSDANEVDRIARSKVAKYFKENVPVLKVEASVHCQVHSNQGFGGGEEKWDVSDYNGNTHDVTIGTYKTPQKKRNSYAEKLAKVVNKDKAGIKVFENLHASEIDHLIKKYCEGDPPSSETCRNEIYSVLSADMQATDYLSYWAGTDITSIGISESKIKGGEKTIIDPITGKKKKVNASVNTSDKALIAQTISYLGALMSVWKATSDKATNDTHILRYTKNMYSNEITDEYKTKVPVLVVETIQPVLSPKGNFWVSPTDYFIQIMDVTKSDFDEYSKNVGDKHSCGGKYLQLVYNIHKYKKVNKSGSSVQGCCKIKSGFYKNLFPRWYSKRMTCDDSSYDSFWKTHSNAQQAERIQCSDGMYGFVVCGSPPMIDTGGETGFNACFELSETGTIDAVEKGYVDSELKMKEHKISVNNVRLDFGSDNKEAKRKRDALISFTNTSETDDVYLYINTYAYMVNRKNKVSSKNSNFKFIREKGKVLGNFKDYCDSTGTSSLRFIENPTIKVKKAQYEVSRFKWSETTCIRFSKKQFKEFCELSDGKTKGSVSTNSFTVSTSLSDNKLTDILVIVNVDVMINTNDPDVPQEGYENDKSNLQRVTYKARKITDHIPTEPIYFESTIPNPKAEIKCGTVSDSGATEEFEAMTGFPTTSDLYFASGGNEYVVQLEYEYKKSKNGFRTYTQDTETARSSLTIPYSTQKGAQKSKDAGPEPKPLKAKCPNCGHEIECKWFAVKVEETHWDWSATATATCDGHPGPNGTTKTHSDTDTKTTSDSEKPGPPAVAKIEGKEVKVKQSEVRATRWNWEWRNYGHANDYNTSDGSNLPYSEPQSFPIGKSVTTTNTLNSKYTNNVGHINNASESNVTMPNSTQFGIIAHKQSWNQPIEDFNYAKITDCKVWKLTEAKVKGTYSLTEQDEITAEVQSVDDSHLYNVAETDTAKDGRFWHDQKPEEKDEYMFNTFNPNGYCEFCVEYEAGKFLKDQNPQDIKNSTTCISDYLILRTTKGDLSMLYFDYDCKNTTVPVGVVKMKDPKNGGSYEIKCDPVKFTDQNENATYEKICLENPMTHYKIKLPEDGITYGGYNGKYDAPASKYTSSSKFEQNVDIPSLTISKDTYSKYNPTQEPSKVFKLVKNGIDVPDWRVVNGEYCPYDSSVFYANLINYGTKHSNILPIDAQEEYGGKVGATLETTYSDKHFKINNVVVHNPVSTRFARLIRLDSSRDQRTTSSLPESLPKKEDKCPRDPASCAYSHLNCEYTGNEYHDKTCYEDTENTVFGPPAEMDIPDGLAQGTTFDFDYTGSMQSVTLPAGAYKLEAWGAQGVNKGGKGGYSSGNITLSSTQTLYIGVGGQGAEFNGGHATSNKHSGSGGATHIGYKNSQLSSYASDYSSQLLLVAGGGGGSENRSNWSGGAGGGANQNGADGVGGYPNRGSGHGGTLSKGGEKGVGNYSSSGTFGVGGTNTAGNKSGGAMGGGGFYGGGAGGSDYSQFNDLDDGSGGGGSGYANTSLLTGISGSTGDKEGSGHVRITYTSPSTDKGLVADFDYTGKTKKMTLQNGVYKFEVWGAQGGDGSSTGGKGGYSSGTFTVSSPTDIYITVGAKGNTFNGGGKGNGKGANGGGASHIALVNGQLSTLSSNKDSILLVAGGGGGAQAKGAGSGGGANQNGTQGTAGFGTAGKLATLTGGYAFGQGGPSLTGTDNNYGGAGGGGYYGGGGATSDGSLVDDKGGAGGSGYANTSKIRDIYGETGVHEGDGHIRITALSSPQTVTFKELTCTEVHHSANTNWHYYVIGWEKENGSVISGFEKVSGKIRPRNTTEWFDTAKIKSDLVLIKADDEYKLAKRANPYIDLETGQPQTIEKYTTNGTTYSDCIWNLTDVNGASIHTKSSKCLNHHYSFGEDVCWDPCNNDNNHKSEPPSYAASGNGANSEYFLNLDWGFQLYFPNLGDFYGNGAYGVSETSAVEGKGYYGLPGGDNDEMDTTKWLKNKYVTFGFDVIYDRNCNGIYGDDQLYIAGEPVPLGHINQETKSFVDDQPNTYTYNFYIPMEQDETYNSSIEFCAVANNSPSDLWGDNYDTQNYERLYMAAKHDAYKEIHTDVVGRIGGLTMVDTGDFRFANLFKQSLSGWLVDNIVHKVNTGKQNYYMADPVNVRGEVGSDATNGLNTHGTQTYKQDISKLMSFPLVPMKNNIASLQKQPQRIGYLNYMSLETIGNYYGENGNGGDTYKTQVTPFFYHLDLNNNTWTPVDVYMLVDGVYKRIAEFGDTDATTDYEWFYRLNWLEEYERRSFTSGERDTTNGVLSKYKYLQYDQSDVMAAPDEKWFLMPSGKDYVYGTPNRLFLKNKNRTFIGSTLTQSNDTNPGKRIDEDRYKLHGQRWHFHLGLPSSAVFIPSGMQPTEENIAKYNNSHSVAVCAIEVLARGTQWTLKYAGVPTSEQVLQILPGGAAYPYAGNNNGPGDKIITTVYSTNRSSKDDLNTQGTH